MSIVPKTASLLCYTPTSLLSHTHPFPLPLSPTSLRPGFVFVFPPLVFFYTFTFCVSVFHLALRRGGGCNVIFFLFFLFVFWSSSSSCRATNKNRMAKKNYKPPKKKLTHEGKKNCKQNLLCVREPPLIRYSKPLIPSCLPHPPPPPSPSSSPTHSHTPHARTHARTRTPAEDQQQNTSHLPCNKKKPVKSNNGMQQQQKRQEPDAEADP